MLTERTPDLAHPGDLEAGWRVAACLSAALFGPHEATGADRHGWTHDDGGGTWARVVVLRGERAVLIGWDRDATRTTDHEIDVLAAAPEWVRTAAATVQHPAPGIGFAAWFVDGRWHTHEHPVEDGLTSWIEKTAFATVEGRRALVDDALDTAAMDHLTEDDPREEARASDLAIARVLDEGYHPTRGALLAMVVFEELDLDAAADAIRAFADVLPLDPATMP